jgi:anti-sigma B factor antagonist
MSFRFFLERPSEDGQPLLVRLSGRMTLGPHLLEFSRSVISALSSVRARAVLLEVSQVEEIDSSGLGELVILYSAAGQQHCRIGLLNPPPQIVRLLERTRLRAILPDFRDLESARAGLSGKG